MAEQSRATDVRTVTIVELSPLTFTSSIPTSGFEFPVDSTIYRLAIKVNSSTPLQTHFVDPAGTPLEDMVSNIPSTSPKSRRRRDVRTLSPSGSDNFNFHDKQHRIDNNKGSNWSLQDFHSDRKHLDHKHLLRRMSMKNIFERTRSPHLIRLLLKSTGGRSAEAEEFFNLTRKHYISDLVQNMKSRRRFHRILDNVGHQPRLKYNDRRNRIEDKRPVTVLSHLLLRRSNSNPKTLRDTSRDFRDYDIRLSSVQNAFLRRGHNRFSTSNYKLRSKRGIAGSTKNFKTLANNREFGLGQYHREIHQLQEKHGLSKSHQTYKHYPPGKTHQLSHQRSPASAWRKTIKKSYSNSPRLENLAAVGTDVAESAIRNHKLPSAQISGSATNQRMRVRSKRTATLISADLSEGMVIWQMEPPLPGECDGAFFFISTLYVHQSFTENDRFAPNKTSTLYAPPPPLRTLNNHFKPTGLPREL
ncbi:uncharacterized protein LOC118478014 [Aplysia californica]|uniref:Uncharacterized protein LOC118478014 n=1 Tax=Aplysia californica TaxID=6500 RepID=A0ABM1VWG0_APLCA|nr:uncharacterized protein LOC118478014 [Aplysia californica]